MLIFALDVINVFLLVISNKLSIFMSKGYANISLSVKAAFWFVFCTLLQKAFSFVTGPQINMDYLICIMHGWELLLFYVQ